MPLPWIPLGSTGYGAQDFSLCPSPGSLWDRRGMGHLEVEGNLESFTRRYGRIAPKKTTTRFELADRHAFV